MMENNVIELKCSVDVADSIENRVRTVGVRGLDFDKARQLGFFTRISNLLCASHVSIMAAYRIYGCAASMMNDFGSRRNDISKAMNDFEKAFMKFTSFWTDYYAHDGAGKEVNEESEALFGNIMRWAQIPVSWNLGDDQRTEDDPTEPVMRIETEEKVFTFRPTTVREVVVGASDESWCVSKYDTADKKQTVIEEDMDKASAMMVAKRLSSEDGKNIYTACLVSDFMEKKTHVTPFKSYMGNQTVGNITKTMR